MVVSAFNSRPVIRSTELPSGRASVLTFADVIDRFGCDIKQPQLEQAYRRAGQAFRGQMVQNFVVMNEAGVVGLAKGALSLGVARGGSSSGLGHGQWQERGWGGRGPRNISEMKCFKCNGLAILLAHALGVDCLLVVLRCVGGPRGRKTPARKLTRKRTRSGEAETDLGGAGHETTSQKRFAWGDEM